MFPKLLPIKRYLFSLLLLFLCVTEVFWWKEKNEKCLFWPNCWLCFHPSKTAFLEKKKLLSEKITRMDFSSLICWFLFSYYKKVSLSMYSLLEPITTLPSKDCVTLTSVTIDSFAIWLMGKRRGYRIREHRKKTGTSKR